MPKSYARQDRVANLIQRELAQIIQHDIIEPRVKMITITDVKVNKDLKFAKVYISLLDPEQERDIALECLNNAKASLRHQLRGLHLRHLPELRFYYDEVGDTGRRIDQLLGEMN